MNCPRKFLAVALAWGLVGAGWAFSQSSPTLRGPGATQQQQPAPPPPPPPPPDPRAQIRSTVSLVVVPVTVKTHSGDLVIGLGQRDFRVFEDGFEQQIASFSAEPFPLSVAVLLDDDLKRSAADHVQQTLQAVAGGFSMDDEVALWKFDEVPEEVSDFIGDPDTLLDQLKRIDLNSSIPGAGSAPMTAGPSVNTQQPPGPIQSPVSSVGQSNNKHITDAIYAAAEQLGTRGNDRRKVIFLISDGENARNNTHSYDETLKLCLASDVSVYTVAVGQTNFNPFNIVSKYAHATGGDIFYASSRADLERLYSRASDQARNQYTISYVPLRGDSGKAYHAIEVRVERPGVIVSSRDGYYPNQLP